MTWLVVLVGVFVAALGVLGIVQPHALVGLVRRRWATRAGLALGVALRVVLGLILLAVAGESRFPTALRALGVLSLAAAVAAPIVGFARLQRFVVWWSMRPAGFIRAWSVVACALGAFLIYAVA